MAKPYIITALDLGSGSIKALSVVKKPGKTNFEVLGLAQEPSLGIKRGVVINPAQVAKTISSLIGKIEQDAGVKIDEVYAGIDGGHIFSTFSRGLVSVSRADQKISEEDVLRVLQAAQDFSLPSNKKNHEIIETFPKEFVVDGEGGIKEAVGLQGVRLEADVLVLCGFSPYLKNSSKTILNSGLQINELIPTSLASSRAVLDPREKELGVCVLDIGAGTTGMSVFEDESLIHTSVFPVGSSHITNDIAICLKTDIDTAERIKIEFGTCKDMPSCDKKRNKKNNQGYKKDLIEIETDEPLAFTKKALSEIVEARVSEIFDLTRKELKKISRQAQLPAGIVLTGGGARIPGIRQLVKKELKLPCRIGTPVGSSDFQEDPTLSTVYGLVLEGIDMEDEGVSRKREGSGKVRKGFGSFLKKAFGLFIP